jgi:hypothetical protein
MENKRIRIMLRLFIIFHLTKNSFRNIINKRQSTKYNKSKITQSYFYFPIDFIRKKENFLAFSIASQSRLKKILVFYA